jgi:hypothetical protein
MAIAATSVEYPIDMLTFQVDHVIPEELLSDPSGWPGLAALGRPETFEVNSFENWLHACALQQPKASSGV